MAKFCGKVGFVTNGVGARGVFTEDTISEKTYLGDIVRNNRRWEQGESINDSLVVSNAVSIVADAYAYDHISAIRYVEWLGTKWKISSIEINRPRIILQIGGVYNGDEA